MTIPFQLFFDRLMQATDIRTQTDMARALDVNRSAITQAKVRNAVPQKWVLALARRYSLSPDWLEFGTGTPRPAVAGKAERAQAVAEAVRSGRLSGEDAAAAVAPELVYVPKTAARLCAGAGSFEVDAVPVAEYPFPRQFLARMGNPSEMVFMDVVGNSMEPGICDGDMVLVDRSRTRLAAGEVLAVGLEDAIYLKRPELRSGGLVLHSDNPAHSPIEILGDEADSFRVIGKVVWLCRDCRYA